MAIFRSIYVRWYWYCQLKSEIVKLHCIHVVRDDYYCIQIGEKMMQGPDLQTFLKCS